MGAWNSCDWHIQTHGQALDLLLLCILIGKAVLDGHICPKFEIMMSAYVKVTHQASDSSNCLDLIFFPTFFPSQLA